MRTFIVCLQLSLLATVQPSDYQYEASDYLAYELPDYYHEEPKKPPKFLSTSQRFSVEIGGTITFPCDIEQSSSENLMLFKHISPSGRDRIIFVGDTQLSRSKRIGKDGNSFILNYVRKTDAGQYICMFEAEPKPVELRHVLNVQYPAKVERISPDVQKVTQGSSVTLQCNASGNPTPAVTWSKLDGALPSGQQSEEGFSITLKNVSRHEEGTYICTASNGVGVTSSTSISIEVEYKPEITSEQAILRKGKGFEAKLVCIVHGRPAPRVSWYRGEDLVSSDKHVMTHDGAHKHTLAITTITEEDFGPYSCEAKNIHGSATKSMYLTGLPKTPVFTSSPAGGEKSSYTLTWRTETFTPILQYRIRFRKVKENQTRHAPGSWHDELFSMTKVNTRDTHFTHDVLDMQHALDGLEPANDYEATVRVENKFGWSDEAPIFQFFTRKEMAVGRSANSATTLQCGYVLAAGIFMRFL